MFDTAVLGTRRDIAGDRAMRSVVCRVGYDKGGNERNLEASAGAKDRVTAARA
jgi:hypothetical protein